MNSELPSVQASWKPSADITTLKKRATFISQIRRFFDNRKVLEVETPLLSNSTITDVHLDAFKTEFLFHPSGQPHNLYLQTSPEYAMKRLLAAGSGCIYQICKAFRNESEGRFHNPEFTMLEWYRVGYDDWDLMNELDELLQSVLQTPSAERLSYQQAFIKFLNFDPLTIDLANLKNEIIKYSNDDWLLNEDSKDILLQWLFSMQIEPLLGKYAEHFIPCFIYDFPASQAALAKINSSDSRIAHRFELYYKGVELANGFYELQDAQEQQTRFESDNKIRKHTGLESRPIDNHLLAALNSGLPDCAGVAVGIDRLFMLTDEYNHLSETLSFTTNNA